MSELVIDLPTPAKTPDTQTGGTEKQAEQPKQGLKDRLATAAKSAAAKVRGFVQRDNNVNKAIHDVVDNPLAKVSGPDVVGAFENITKEAAPQSEPEMPTDSSGNERPDWQKAGYKPSEHTEPKSESQEQAPPPVAEANQATQETRINLARSRLQQEGIPMTEADEKYLTNHAGTSDVEFLVTDVLASRFTEDQQADLAKMRQVEQNNPDEVDRLASVDNNIYARKVIRDRAFRNPANQDTQKLESADIPQPFTEPPTTKIDSTPPALEQAPPQNEGTAEPPLAKVKLLTPEQGEQLREDPNIIDAETIGDHPAQFPSQEQFTEPPTTQVDVMSQDETTKLKPTNEATTKLQQQTSDEQKTLNLNSQDGKPAEDDSTTKLDTKPPQPDAEATQNLGRDDEATQVVTPDQAKEAAIQARRNQAEAIIKKHLEAPRPEGETDVDIHAKIQQELIDTMIAPENLEPEEREKRLQQIDTIKKEAEAKKIEPEDVTEIMKEAAGQPEEGMAEMLDSTIQELQQSAGGEAEVKGRMEKIKDALKLEKNPVTRARLFSLLKILGIVLASVIAAGALVTVGAGTAMAGAAGSIGK